ncbi:hypothetical protein CARUB_v10007401mg [Capsella rubella]|uniref:Uncharacterized protein n=1 Tax=Capsella rubella TaxID=81985 RepID=R0H5G1_9BRAS|nr:hypothetical protein CARUB_v10007401mg [Capsella rubella]
MLATFARLTVEDSRKAFVFEVPGLYFLKLSYQLLSCVYIDVFASTYISFSCIYSILFLMDGFLFLTYKSVLEKSIVLTNFDLLQAEKEECINHCDINSNSKVVVYGALAVSTLKDDRLGIFSFKIIKSVCVST